MKRGKLALSIVLALSITAASARAQDHEAARRHFEEGVRLLEDSRFAAAARELEASLRLRDSPSALYNLALAYRGLGRYKKAIELFQRFLKSADDPELSPMRKNVEAELAELEAGLVRLTLEISGGAESVVVDRGRVASGDGSRELALDPGPHRIEVSRRGHRPVVKQLDLAPGSRQRLAVRADAEPLPARLVVEANVPEAQIELGSSVVGRGRYDARLDPGRKRLRVAADGYQPYARELELGPGTTERVNVQLERQSSGLLASPWFWGGAAVVVAGAATAVYFATRPSDPEPDRGSLGFVVQALP